MARRPQGISRGAIIVIALLAVLVIAPLVVNYFRAQGEDDNAPDEPKVYQTTPTRQPPSTATAAVRSVEGSIAASRARVTPQEETFKGCPAGGDGTDPQLNVLKNRVDVPANPGAVQFQSLVALPWPEAINRQHMANWSSAARAEVDRYNGQGVSVEAYFIRVQSEGPESPNCHSTTDVDFHAWIVGNQSDDRPSSVVVEFSPRTRAKHAGWTLAAFQSLAKQRGHVRITGWIMLDPEHPDQVGKTRGTIWEIHPVTKVEVDAGGGQWRTLE